MNNSNEEVWLCKYKDFHGQDGWFLGDILEATYQHRDTGFFVSEGYRVSDYFEDINNKTETEVNYFRMLHRDEVTEALLNI